uniref:LIM zinc-binding domain-containing protein n=1 Tax=Ursus americanus TaxID=9643 RepID=A0A452R2X2_URSAM
MRVGTPRCPACDKVSSLGKDWHKFCLKCERCSKTLTPGGHAEHDGKPFCHKPCYATLFGPKGELGSPSSACEPFWHREEWPLCILDPAQFPGPFPHCPFWTLPSNPFHP